MTARSRRPYVAAVLVGGLLSAATGSWAASTPQAPKVILIRPPTAPPGVGEALVRLRGELVAAGFDAEVTARVLGPDVRGSLEKLAPPSVPGAATALVAVVAGADPGRVELWVIDRVTGKTVVREVDAGGTDPPRVAEVLSVRAVELLRASFLELAISPPPSPDARSPAPVVERFATATLHEADWTWAVEAGGGTAAAVEGPWNAILSVARLERAFGPRFCGRITFTGLGTAARVDTPDGYVALTQTVLLGEAVVRFQRGRWIEPLLSLGAGALRLAADSHESAPYQALSGARWAVAADLGIGARFPLRRHRFELGVELHALVAQPYPTVRFFGSEVARAGRPSLIGSVTLLGGL